MFPTLHGLNISLSLSIILIFIYLFAPLVFSQKTNLKGKKGRNKRVMKSNQSMPLFNSPYGCNHHLKEKYFSSVLEVKSAFAIQGPAR